LTLEFSIDLLQAIAVLGGMGFCAGLLSSSDVPVQANACLAGASSSQSIITISTSSTSSTF
jgi:hypothetical protein